MANWTTPKTANVGDVYTASWYNTHTRDNLSFLYPSIADTVLAADTETIDITGIPSTYRHLEVFAWLRADAGTNQNCWINFNNDSGNNYDYQSSRSSGTGSGGAGVTQQEGLAQQFIQLPNAVPGSSAPANVFSFVLFVIPNYAATNMNKMTSFFWGVKVGTTSGSMDAGRGIGFWRSNSAITRVTLSGAVASAWQYVTNSRVTIYGRWFLT